MTPILNGSPGALAARWLHVVHRGLGRRPVFSTAQDVNTLLDGLAREAERRSLELHAFTVLTNHCHLLVRARPGPLSSALQRVFSVYSRRFNRRLHRDGAVFRGRARIRRVVSARHWQATVAYIDRNPVDAGLARSPARYPHGSAWHYARAAGPRWLERGAIEEFVRSRMGAASYQPSDYAKVFGEAGVPDSSCAVVGRRLQGPEVTEDPLDDLIGAAPPAIRRWFETMAHRADGGAAAATLVDPRTVLDVIERVRGACGPWPLPRGAGAPEAVLASPLARRGGSQRDGWSVLACGLLRTACGLTLHEVGRLVGLSDGSVYLHVQCHQYLVTQAGPYKERAAEALQSALRCDHPQGTPDRTSSSLGSG